MRELDVLDTRDWLTIASILTELVQYPANELDEATRMLLERLGGVLGAACSVGILCHRRAEPVADGVPDPLHGWRPVHLSVYGELLEQMQSASKEWMSGDPGQIADGLAAPFLQHAGQVRCHRQIDLYPDQEAYRQSRGYQLDQTMGIVDVLVGGRPIAVNMEMALVFYSLDASFSEHDRALVLATLQGLAPTCERYAQSLGLLPGQQRLSPRERETLSYLLQDMSEKEVARSMNVQPATVHEYVTAVYRKLNVSSRAELMALWLT